MPNPSTTFERIALATGFAPFPVPDYVSALAMRTVFTAMRLGVFDFLMETPTTAAEVAARIGLDLRGTETLLDALTSIGYLHRRADVYRLESRAKTWMPRLAPGIDFYEWMLGRGWDGLPDRLHGIGTDDCEHTWLAGDSLEDNFGGMVSNARLAAPEVVRRVGPGHGPHRLLDLGGGHGLFASAFAQANPRLTANVLDLPDVIALARDVQANEPGADRVHLEAADMWSHKAELAYDTVLLFNLLNAYDPPRQLRLLHLAKAALKPGGRLVVFDQMRRSRRAGTSNALVELTNLRLFNPDRGGTYTLANLRQLLSECGAVRVSVKQLFTIPWATVVIARKPRNHNVPFPTYRKRHDRKHLDPPATRLRHRRG